MEESVILEAGACSENVQNGWAYDVGELEAAGCAQVVVPTTARWRASSSEA